MPLVLKSGTDPVPMEAPQLLHQTVVLLLGPLLAQELLDGLWGARRLWWRRIETMEDETCLTNKNKNPLSFTPKILLFLTSRP